jgi:hypothetical protein
VGVAEDLLGQGRLDFAAQAAGGDITESWLRIGDRPVRIRVVGRGLARRLLAPVGHLATATPAGAAALTISCWSSTGEPGLAPLLPAPGEIPAQVRYADLSDDRCLMAWPSERLVEGFEDRDGAAEAWWWVPDVEAVPTAELAMPFRPILHWWSEERGLLMVHAAAVGTVDGGAVLLGGVSGSGKSTTALWSLRSPRLRFLGDDYVLVDPTPPATVFSLYTTAKIHEPDQGRVPHVRAEVVGRQEADKLVTFLGRRYPDRIVERMPLRAILLPRRTADGPLLTAVDSGEALRRLGPSTVLQFPGPRPQRSLAALGRLTRDLPCFDLALGPDPAATPAVIEGYLAEPTTSSAAGAER